jgi:nucleotide-binding universal stress UspA family protein
MASRQGIAMCAKRGAHLYPFSMVLSNPEYETQAPELVQSATEQAREHLESIVADAALQGVSSTMLMRLGDSPDREIVAAAQEINADLIAMGQQGRRDLARMMVGHATVNVIGAAACSVLSVPVGAGRRRHVAKLHFARHRRLTLQRCRRRVGGQDRSLPRGTDYGDFRSGPQSQRAAPAKRA